MPIDANDHCIVVSVVITAFNQSLFIKQAVDSVLAQTLPGVECIISDDGSTDDTLSVCAAAYAGNPKVKIVTHANSGPGSTRNYGFSHCASSSRYLVFLDGDDWLEPNFVSHTVAYLTRHPEAGLVTTGYVLANADGIIVGSGKRTRYCPGLLGFPRKLKDTEKVTPFAAFYAATGQGPFALYRRSVFEQTSGWETGFWPHEDTDMFCQMALKAQVHHCLDQLYIKRDHVQSVTKRKFHSGQKDLGQFKANSYELFRKKWLSLADRTSNKGDKALLLAAERYYYGLHMPLRNLQLALQSIGRAFPRFSEPQRWWIKSLLRTSIEGILKVWLLNRRPTALSGKIL